MSWKILLDEEPNEEQRFIYLAPHHGIHRFNSENFQLGLELNDEQFKWFERKIEVEFELSNLLNVDDFESSDAKYKIRRSVENLQHHLGTLEDGQRAIPSWYMSEWVKKIAINAFTSTKKRERDRLNAIALESQRLMTGGPAYPPNTYLGRIERATIKDMTVVLVVWRSGSHNKVEQYDISAARLVMPGKENDSHLSTSYSYQAFKSIFEAKMKKKYPKLPSSIDKGRCGYFHRNGDWKLVENQDDFEVALNHIFLARGNEDILKFILQPEHSEDQLEREIREAESFDDAEIDRIAAEVTGRDLTGGRKHDVANPSSGVDEVEGISTGEPISPRSTSRPGSRSSRPASRSSACISGIPIPTTPRRVKSPRSLENTPQETPQRPMPGEFPFTPPDSTQKSSSLGEKVRRTLSMAMSNSKDEPPKKPLSEYDAFKAKLVIRSIVAFKRSGKDVVASDIAAFEKADSAVSDDEAEIPYDSDEDDETVSDEDRVVAKLQAMQDLPELSQLGDDLSMWNECCAMFGIDPNQTAIDETIPVAGLNTKLYQYQVFGVYWQMLTSRKLGGGFVGDSMGLGKTLSFLAYFVVERQLSCLWTDVQSSRQKDDKKHLQEDQHSENDVCPTPRKDGWIACPCASSSITSKLAPKRGVRLACVPDALVNSWWNQWKTHIDQSDLLLGLRLIIDYDPAFNMYSSQADLLMKSSQARNKTQLESERLKRDTDGDDIAKPQQDRYLVLTTRNSYMKWIQKFEYEVPAKRSSIVGRKEKRPGIVFGFAMIDECHDEYFKGKGRGEVLCKIPPGNRPFLWGYSGTPFSQTPRGLEGVLWAIEKQSPVLEKGQTGWESDPVMKAFSTNHLDDICKRFDEQLKSKKPDDTKVEQALNDFKLFLQNFMIRRRAETEWFGHTLIRLKPHLHQDVILDRGPEFGKLEEQAINWLRQFQAEKDEYLVKLQEKWDKQDPSTRRTNVRPARVAFNSLCRLEWRQRLLATFPALIKNAVSNDDKSSLTLTEDECLGFIHSSSKSKSNPYIYHIRNLVENSPKCIWLYFLIHRICEQKDVDGQEQKLVIVSEFTQVIYILKLFIEKYFPDRRERVGMVVPRLKIKERTKEIEAFTDAVDDNRKRKQAKDNQFLVGTRRLLGQGLQLTRACNIVLMEPDYEFVRELQGYARVHRIGQKNPTSFSYRLIDLGSDIEQRILKRQHDRKEFAGRKLSDEEVGELDSVTKSPLEMDEVDLS